MRKVHSAAGGIHQQQQQFHIRLHPQLSTALTLMLHRGKPINATFTLLSLILVPHDVVVML